MRRVHLVDRGVPGRRKQEVDVSGLSNAAEAKRKGLSFLATVIGAAGLAVAVLGAAPAGAHDVDRGWHDDGWRRHHHRHHPEYRRDIPPVMEYVEPPPRFVPPPVVVPPPFVFAPPFVPHGRPFVRGGIVIGIPMR